MFKKELLEEAFNQKITVYEDNIHDIQFDLDLSKFSNFDKTKFAQYSTFVLEESGLLTLLITLPGGIMEYHKKIKNVNDLKYAISNLDEWEDDWN